MTKRKKIRLEYPVKSSPRMLFNCISTPSGLSQWFADDVDIYNNNYKFKWDKDEQIAELLKKNENKMIRFRWKDATNPDEFFEFEIIQDELTDDVALVVVDFVDIIDEQNAVRLWDSQVHELKTSLGG